MGPRRGAQRRDRAPPSLPEAVELRCASLRLGEATARLVDVSTLQSVALECNAWLSPRLFERLGPRPGLSVNARAPLCLLTVTERLRCVSASPLGAPGGSLGLCGLHRGLPVVFYRDTTRLYRLCERRRGLHCQCVSRCGPALPVRGTRQPRLTIRSHDNILPVLVRVLTDPSEPLQSKARIFCASLSDSGALPRLRYLNPRAARAPLCLWGAVGSPCCNCRSLRWPILACMSLLWLHCAL